MLDIRDLRHDPEGVGAALARRGLADAGGLIAAIVDRDRARRQALAEVNDLKALRNRVSREIGAARRRGESAEAEIARMREVGESIARLDAAVAEADEWIASTLLGVPNAPDPRVPAGGVDENVVVRSWGTPTDLPFEPRPHWELGESLGILDLAGGGRVSGSGFFVLQGAGAALQRGLVNWMIGLHTGEHGYRELRVPYLVKEDSMTGTGQLPKFAEESYLTRRDGLWLIPTAEVPVTNLHRGQILQGDRLPIKYVAYSPCFRREAGAAGKDTRGMLRVHQFDKVELVRFERPEDGGGCAGGTHERGVQDSGAARTAVSRRPARGRRPGLLGLSHLRPGGVGAGRASVAGGVQLLDLFGLPGEAGPDSLSSPTGRRHRIRAHPQRIGTGAAAVDGGPAGDMSAPRRVDPASGYPCRGRRFQRNHSPAVRG